MEQEGDLVHKLKGEWYSCLGDGPEQEEALAEVLRRYSKEGRHYHTAKHIKMCLDELAWMEKNPALELGDAYDVVPMVYAIFFHDAVYNPKARDDDNVRASAELWKDRAEKMGVADWVIEQTYNLIIVTDHKTKPDTLHKKLMVDLDLVILGKDEETFFEYDKNIRKEYAHVPWEVFKEKRVKVLRGFVEREHIYSTLEFQERYEKKAEENLEKCILRLEDPATADYLLPDQ